jgi:hypothetical protein
MNSDPNRTKLEELNERDIQEMSDNTGLDKDVLRSSIEKQRADDKYKAAQSETTYETKDYVSKLKKTLRFFQSAFIRNPTVPKKSKITDIKSPEYSSEIIIEMESPYPKIYCESTSKDKLNGLFKYNLDKNEDKRDLDYILDKAGVNKPSQLIGETIPVDVNDSGDGHLKTADPKIETYKNPVTVFDKIQYIYRRTLLYTKSIERKGKSKNTQGEWMINRNALLFWIFPLLALGVGILEMEEIILHNFVASLPIFMALSLILSYLFVVSITLIKGLFAFLSKKPENREYINKYINK